MISNTTGIRPSQFHFTPLPLLLGHAPFSRQILLSQRPGFTTRASLFCHHQNPKTFPASSQFWFTGLVYTVFKIAGHTPNPALSFSASGSSVVLLAVGFYYTLYDSKWKSINSMFLGLYSLATTVLFGRDLAILNGKAMLASGAATLAIVVSVTKLAFWEPEKKPMALEFRPLFIMLTLPVQIIAGCIQIWAPGPISTAIYHGITIISLSNIVFHQSKRLLKVSDEND
ncbi:hypothetical protein WN944_025594 [Citrus x changshan-huyou]|uniref:Uncharacterized protein n=1 Tax=Citrus x changshan-huyou TaxID=2935761 RepID=A0AAP0QD38_9ROSI